MNRLDSWFLKDGRTIPVSYELVLVAAILTLAFAVRVATAGQDSLWIDEGYSLSVAKSSTDLLWTTPFDVHPPLYYTLLKPFLLLDDSAFQLRLLSVLTSTIALAPLYIVARWMMGNVGALVAMAIGALSFTSLVYSANARNYAVLMFFLALAFMAIFRYVQIKRGEHTAGQREVWGWIVAYNIAAVAALYTHNVALFYIILVNAGFWLLQVFTQPRHIVSFTWKLIMLNHVVVLAWVPWLLVVMSTSTDFSWLQQPDLRTVANTIMVTVLPNRSTILGPLFVLLAMGLGGLACLHRQRQALAIGMFHALVFPLFIWVIGFVLKPIFMERIILPALVAPAIFIGAAAAFIKDREKAGLVAGLAVMACATSTYSYLNRPSDNDSLGGHVVQDWRNAVADVLAVNEEEGQRALILCNSFSIPTAAEYASGAHLYIMRGERRVAALPPQMWHDIFMLPATERAEGFFVAYDRLLEPGQSAFQSFDYLASNYETVGVASTDIFCDETFHEMVAKGLSGSGFIREQTFTKQYAGVTVRRYERH